MQSVGKTSFGECGFLNRVAIILVSFLQSIGLTALTNFLTLQGFWNVLGYSLQYIAMEKYLQNLEIKHLLSTYQPQKTLCLSILFMYCYFLFYFFNVYIQLFSTK